MQLAPADATFAERLAVRREELGLESLSVWRRSAALDPGNSDRWMNLALRAEMAGDYALAERSLLTAAEHSRLYQPRYLLAEYYFRRQNAAAFWPWARAALETCLWRRLPPLRSLLEDAPRCRVAEPTGDPAAAGHRAPVSCVPGPRTTLGCGGRPGAARCCATPAWRTGRCCSPTATSSWLKAKSWPRPRSGTRCAGAASCPYGLWTRAWRRRSPTGISAMNPCRAVSTGGCSKVAGVASESYTEPCA